jgi:integrase
MAPRLRSAQLETRTARLKLPLRLKPYWLRLSPGIFGGYRRNQAAGTWSVRNRKADWIKRIGLADDYEDADGEHVLTFDQMVEKARALVRGSADAARPITVEQALDAYKRDLIANGRGISNATRIYKYLPTAMASKPISLLTARELAAFRDTILTGGTIKRSSMKRTMKSFIAALNLAARLDPRITYKPWTDGLAFDGGAAGTRNASALSNDQVLALIAACYAIDAAFGLYIEVAAQTGARLSQIARLVVSDLKDGKESRLMMPCSHKGRGKRTVTKKPVPITPELAKKLKSNRPPDAPLLLRADGRAWQSINQGDHTWPFRDAVAACKLETGSDGKKVTAYSLRHSFIIRSLLAGTPTRVVASLADTSIRMLEAHYSPYILDHADAVARLGLLQT